MEDIVDKFPSTWENVELEFKLEYVNKFKIQQFIEKNFNSKDANIERSINCIKITDNYSTIYRIIIDKEKGGKKIVDTYTKKNIATEKLAGVKLKLSLEEPVSGFLADHCDILRFKNRLSSIVIPDWRLDITLVKSARYVQWSINILEAPVRHLLRAPNMTPDNFYETAPWDYADHIEVELEYVGTVKPTIENLQAAMEYIDKKFPREIKSESSLTHARALGIIADFIQPKFSGKYYSGKWGIKNLANSVTTLDIDSLYNKLLPNVIEYTVSPKIDGVRSIIFIHKNITYLVNNEITVFEYNVPDSKTYIFDAELFEDPNENNKIKLYLFDCMVFADKNIMYSDYKTRLNFAEKIVDGGLMKMKPVTFLNKNWKKSIKTLLVKKYIYETDGLIFTPISESYADAIIYKWKPEECMSIDFIYRDNSLYSGIMNSLAKKLLPKKLYDDSEKKYIPAKFYPTYSICKDIYNLKIKGIKDNTLVELVWKENKWVLLKTRSDRNKAISAGVYFGNDYRIADKVWHSIHWPITDKMLTSTTIPKKYKCATPEFVAANVAYFENIYTDILKKYPDVTKVIDTGTFFPEFNHYTVKSVDFIISDGFTCLKIINNKYDKSFRNDLDHPIEIFAYDSKTYKYTAKEKTLVIAFFPIKTQLTKIKKLSKNKNVSVFILDYQKKLKNNGISNDTIKMTDDYPVNLFTGEYDIDDIYYINKY